MPNINDPTAETSSVLDLFQHVFIPTYDYDASLGEMKVSLNISNVNALYVDQLQYQGVGIGDANGNFSIGTSNTGSFALFSNTVEIGFATGRNLASGSNVIVFGNYALQSGNVASDSVVLGTFAAEQAVTTQNAVVIGHAAGNIATNLSGSVIIGEHTCSNVGSVLGSVVIGDRSCGTGSVVNSVVLGADVDAFNGGSNVFMVGDTLLTGRFDCNAIAIGKQVDVTTTYALDVSGNTNLSGNVDIAGGLTVDSSSLFLSNVTLSGTSTFSMNNGTCSVFALNNTAEYILNVSQGTNLQQLVLHPATTNFHYVLNNANVFTANNTGFILSNGNMQLNSNLSVSGTSLFASNVTISGMPVFFRNVSGESTTLSNQVVGGAQGNQFIISASGQSLTSSIALQPDRRIVDIQGGLAWHTPSAYRTVAQGGEVIWNQVNAGAGTTEFVNARGGGSGGGFAFYDGLDAASAANLSLCMTATRTRVSIPTTLNVSGAATFGSNVTISSTLSVSGVATFGSDVNLSTGSTLSIGSNTFKNIAQGMTAVVDVVTGNGPIVQAGQLCNIGVFFDFTTTTIGGIPLCNAKAVRCVVGGDQGTFKVSPTAFNAFNVNNSGTPNIYMFITDVSTMTPQNIHHYISPPYSSNVPYNVPNDNEIMQAILYPAYSRGFQLGCCNVAAAGNDAGFDTSMTYINVTFYPLM